MSCQAIYPIKQNDTGCDFTDHLELDGESLDMADVHVCIKSQSGDILVDEKQGTILQTGDDQDKTEPNVRWRPQTGDLDIAKGIHLFEWHVELANGKKLTMPRGSAEPGSDFDTDGYYLIKVYETLQDW